MARIILVMVMLLFPAAPAAVAADFPPASCWMNIQQDEGGLYFFDFSAGGDRNTYSVWSCFDTLDDEVIELRYFASYQANSRVYLDAFIPPFACFNAADGMQTVAECVCMVPAEGAAPVCKANAFLHPDVKRQLEKKM